MAHKKKKTQSQHANVHRIPTVPTDKAHVVIKKILRVYGLDPNLFDSYTKQQKRFLFQLIVEPTRVKVEEGHRVPRRLVNFMAESTHHFLRTHYFGDESIGLTYLELSTYGLSFAYMLESAKSFFPFQSGQMETIVYVTETITPHRIHQDLDEVGKHIRKTSMMISKMNFRIYGYNWRVTSAQDEIGVVSTIFMSSENPISIHFKHKQKERIAFRVRAGRVITEPAYNAKIDRWFIFQEDETPSVYLDIYIQSHALQRIKERMDIFPAHKKNYYAMEPLLYMHYVQESPSGRPMLVCYFKDNERFVYLGYFPFIILKNKLIVLTFLPLVSDDTLSGQYLRNRLGLQMEDMVFLGMDKLSFYLTVDFDQIPVLKKALVNTEVWFLVEYAANNPEMNFTIDQKKTKMVKKFFEHKTDPEIDTLSSI